MFRVGAREMLERENKALREAREDALAEADRARTQLAVSASSCVGGERRRWEEQHVGR